MIHTGLFSSHEIRGFTLTTRECIGVAIIEAQEAVASLCLPGDDAHTLSEITWTLLASYIIWSNGYEKMRNITSNCEGDLPTEQSLRAWVMVFKLVWKDYFTVRFVLIILLPQNPSCVLGWIVIVVLSAVLMLKLSGVILFFLLLHIESCDSCGRFSHGWGSSFDEHCQADIPPKHPL